MTSRALPSEPDLAPTDAPLEPLRLLAGGGSELERRLLHSARLDRVPAEAAARVASGLGLDQAIVGRGAPSTPPAASARLSRFGRFGALGGVGGFSVVAALGLIGAGLSGRGPDLARHAADLGPSARPNLSVPVVAEIAAASDPTNTPVAAPSNDASPAVLETAPARFSRAAHTGGHSRAARAPMHPALVRAEAPTGG
ncbi:MAG TPA: hypothetical protein VG963_03580, partial [Polyangiaceae bacterium]|nr:hypothetical protein [Polyangiaceae bacterium]